MIVGHVHDPDGGHTFKIDASIRKPRNRVVIRLKDQSMRLIQIYRILPFTVPLQEVTSIWRSNRNKSQASRVLEEGKTYHYGLSDFLAVLLLQSVLRIEGLLKRSAFECNFQRGKGNRVILLLREKSQSPSMHAR